MLQFARQQQHTHKQNTNLVKRWENVIGKLDLSDRRASRSGVADGKARDPLLTERRVEHAVFAKLFFQVHGAAEHAAERHIFAKHDGARVRRHRDAHRIVDRGKHVHLHSLLRDRRHRSSGSSTCWLHDGRVQCTRRAAQRLGEKRRSGVQGAHRGGEWDSLRYIGNDLLARAQTGLVRSAFAWYFYTLLRVITSVVGAASTREKRGKESKP